MYIETNERIDKMKKLVFGMSLLSIGLFGCGNDVVESQEVDVLFDVTEYARISADELNGKLGEPNEVEEDYMNGSLVSYDHEIGHLEFIIHEDSVTRMNIWSNDAWSGEGEALPYHGEDTMSYFNVEATRDFKVNDTGSTFTISPVSDEIAEFSMELIDEDTFDLLKVTYDVRPYE